MSILLQVLLEWGQQQGHVWDGSVAGPQGLTPLHLAAALPDGGAIALALARHTAPGESGCCTGPDSIDVATFRKLQLTALSAHCRNVIAAHLLRCQGIHSPGASAWFSSETEDGQKPAHFAARATGGSAEGLHAAMMRALAQAGDPATPISTGAFAADELTSGSSPSATGAACCPKVDPVDVWDSKQAALAL